MDERDLDNPEVLGPAQDMFDTFVDHDEPSSTVPEGEEPLFADDDESTDGTSVSEGVNESDPKEYKTRYGRNIKPVHDPNRAATLQAIPDTTDKRFNNVQTNSHLAGGNKHERVSARAKSNAEIHKLDWNPAGFLTGNASYNKRVL